MLFFTALKCGASVKNVAREFVMVLLEKSRQDRELHLETTCNFVNDLFRAIGLECDITPEHVDDDWTYAWPMEQIQCYTFYCIEMDFKKVEDFLREICTLCGIQHEIFVDVMKDLESEDVDSPVELLMQLVAVWCSAFKRLQEFEELHAIKRFEEPLARLNYNLLLGMHQLRKVHRLDLYLLDAICNRLYWSALQGLYYSQTHESIFSGLLQVFSNHYDLFYASSSKTIDFFYDAFIVEINSLTPLKLYQTFQKMLLEDVPSMKLNILLNFLIEPYMLRIYFNTFRAKKHIWHKDITNKNFERMQQEALNFVHILQSKLLSLDCFSIEFMETILNLVFKPNNITASLASNLYMAMMKRKFSDQLTLKHIMNFYATKVGSVTNLKRYVQLLFDGYEFLLNFSNLLELITDEQTEEIIRLLSAHILVIVFELKTKYEDLAAKQDVQQLLKIIPEICENIDCQKTEGILLNVFNLLPIEELSPQVIHNFIYYAKSLFTCTDSHLEYPLLMNIFCIFHKCLMYNNEWQHLELLSQHLFNKYQDMIKNLRQKENNSGEPISILQLDNYNHLIKRLNILMKLKYDLWDNSYLNIIHNLSSLFLYDAEMKLLINENKLLTEIYVLEIIISCLLKLIKQKNDKAEIHTFLPEVQKLFMLIWSTMQNLEEIIKLPVVKIKSYFCCLLQLIIHLQSKLDNQMYHQLVQILIAVIFKNKSANPGGADELQQLYPLRSIEYQHLMLRLFTEMHKYQKVQINTNMVWKLCIYYRMPRHDFQEDLKNLLITLANHRLHIYKHIIAVIVYNLYKQTPALRPITIVSILKQHKYLIDNDINIDSPQLLKVHVVLLVLQILAKALTVQRIRPGHNRLEALKHLNIFIEGLDLKRLQAKQLLLEQINEIKQQLLDAEESKLITNFKQLLN